MPYNNDNNIAASSSNGTVVKGFLKERPQQNTLPTTVSEALDAAYVYSIELTKEDLSKKPGELQPVLTAVINRQAALNESKAIMSINRQGLSERAGELRIDIESAFNNAKTAIESAVDVEAVNSAMSSFTESCNDIMQRNKPLEIEVSQVSISQIQGAVKAAELASLQAIKSQLETWIKNIETSLNESRDENKRSQISVNIACLKAEPFIESTEVDGLLTSLEKAETDEDFNNITLAAIQRLKNDLLEVNLRIESIAKEDLTAYVNEICNSHIEKVFKPHQNDQKELVQESYNAMKKELAECGQNKGAELSSSKNDSGRGQKQADGNQRDRANLWRRQFPYSKSDKNKSEKFSLEYNPKDFLYGPDEERVFYKEIFGSHEQRKLADEKKERETSSAENDNGIGGVSLGLTLTTAVVFSISFVATGLNPIAAALITGVVMGAVGIVAGLYMLSRELFGGKKSEDDCLYSRAEDDALYQEIFDSHEKSNSKENKRKVVVGQCNNSGTKDKVAVQSVGHLPGNSLGSFMKASNVSSRKAGDARAEKQTTVHGSPLNSTQSATKKKAGQSRLSTVGQAAVTYADIAMNGFTS